MGRVAHFEIHASDPAGIMPFYEQLFAWKFTPFPGPWDYWFIETPPAEGPTITGGLIKRQGSAPVDGAAVNASVISVEVAFIRVAVERVPELGGRVVVPVKAIPEVGWLAYIKDPDGNLVGLIQNDAEAR